MQGRGSVVDVGFDKEHREFVGTVNLGRDDSMVGASVRLCLTCYDASKVYLFIVEILLTIAVDDRLPSSHRLFNFLKTRHWFI